MTKQHTPEPWEYSQSIDKDYFLHDRRLPGEIKNIQIIGDIDAEEDARRIVACVNACTGISTEALESGIVEELIKILEAFVKNKSAFRPEEPFIGPSSKLFKMAEIALKKTKGVAPLGWS